MPPSFHSLRIRERRPESPDSVSLAFEVPDALRDDFRFVQGQFVTLRASIDGTDQRRSYSICSGVDDYDREGELRIAIRRVPGGLFSNWANANLEAGQRIDVMTPDGRFFVPLQPERARRYLGIAGGSGITPVLSVIKTVLVREPASEFTLIYGNRTLRSIMFVEELEDLKNRFLDRFRLHHVLSDESQEIALLEGLLDEDKCRQFLDTVVPASSLDEVFVCGPEPMMVAAEKALAAAGVPADRIHVERFGVPPPPAGAQVRAATLGDTMSQVVIEIDGKRRTVPVLLDGSPILDAGLSDGLNLPYACRAGVCCTCRARVLEGEVRMDRNYTLEAHELQAGFVLTCQSHPLTPRVVLSYDER